MSGELVFISYRGSDLTWAIEFVNARLVDVFGAGAVFKAGNSIKVAEPYPQRLRKQAASCPVMLVCIGPGWLTAADPAGGRRLDLPDDWVRQEIGIALQAGNHVIPLLMGNIDQVPIPAADDLPADIRPMVLNQACRLFPGKNLGPAVLDFFDRLAELVPELAERRAALHPGPGTAGGRPVSVKELLKDGGDSW